MNYNVLLFLLIFSCFSSRIFAQGTVSKPQIFNYSSGDYKGGIQNWDVAQDSKGIMYFGNNEGLLSFDGQYWRIYPLPNATVVRSISIDKRDRIYVGGQDEIGYFEPNENRLLEYHSLTDKLPKADRFFSDVWNIEVLGENVFFQTPKYIFRFNEGKVLIDRAKSSWQFLGESGGKIYAQEMDIGLMQYNNGVWHSILKVADINEDVITDIISCGNDSLLISTLRNGLYCFSKGVLTKKVISGAENLSSMRISALHALGNGRYAVGTIAGGLFILDKAGNLIQRYVFNEGLQTNHVRSVYVDKSRNLWLAMDDGIDFIAINSSIGYIQPDIKNSVGAYSIRVFDGQLFLGTSNGLYVSMLSGLGGKDNMGMSRGTFRKIPNSDGQVWSLQEFNGHLMMSHEDGSFEVLRETLMPISSKIGTWLYVSTSRVSPSDNLIAGTYNGLHHIRYDGQRFVDVGYVANSYESMRFIHYDDNGNSVWFSHPYRGVSRMWLSEDYNKVVRDKKYNLPDAESFDLHNYMFYVKNKVVVCNPKYIYEYNEDKDAFEKSSTYAPLYGLPIQYMTEDKYGNVWFVSNKRLGVLDYSTKMDNQPYTITYFPALNGKILGGFESVYVHDLENVFIGAQKGGILLNYKSYKEQASKPNVLLGMMRVLDREKREKIILGGYGPVASKPIEIANAFNTVQFEFSSMLYEQHNQVEFSYILEGLETRWSPWSNKNEKEYTNLPSGKYVFKIKSRNGMGNESILETISFTIQPPWYAHPVMLFFYLIFFVSFPFWILAMQRKKLKKRHEHELYLTHLEVEKKEKEVIKLRNEKLESELGFKDKELASLTMNIIQRGEALGKIKDNINGTINHIKDSELKSNFRQLVRLIKSADRTNEDWEKFNVHINYANEDFFIRLKHKHADLTPNELKLCALMRMNLQSKEIAQLMHVTTKTVEVSRYRLRKKLGLSSDMNLYDYLLNFTNS